MALNQQFRSTPGRTGLVARIEQPTEPGQPRLVWDPQSGDWIDVVASAASPGVPVEADPEAPGVYFVRVPSSLTASWPPKVYWIAVLDPAAASADRLVEHWPVYLPGGDDGCCPTPAADLVMTDGRVLHLWGAYLKPAPKP